ncbi:DUF465 domain-containing protein [bacterium]|nr:DUF465 domain-containing protein [bacterium]
MSTLKSLQNHLKVLQERHRELDKKVTADYEHRLNSDEYYKEKKDKLHLKEEIAELEEQILLKEKERNGN